MDDDDENETEVPDDDDEVDDVEHISSGLERVGIGKGRGRGNRRGHGGRGDRGGRDTHGDFQRRNDEPNQNRRGRGGRDVRGGRGGREAIRNTRQHYHEPHLNRGDNVGRGDRDGHDAQRDAHWENDVPNQNRRGQSNFRDDQRSGFRKPRNENDVNKDKYQDGHQNNREPYSNRGGRVGHGGRVGFDAQRDVRRQNDELNQDHRGRGNFRNGQESGFRQPRSENDVNMSEHRQRQTGTNQDQFRRPPDPYNSNSAPPLNASYQQYTPPPHMMPAGVYGMPSPMMSTAQGPMMMFPVAMAPQFNQVGQSYQNNPTSYPPPLLPDMPSSNFHRSSSHPDNNEFRKRTTNPKRDNPNVKGVDRKGFARRESVASLEDQENSAGKADCTKHSGKQRKNTAKGKGNSGTDRKNTFDDAGSGEKFGSQVERDDLGNQQGRAKDAIKGKVALKKKERNSVGDDDNNDKENNDHELVDDVVSFMLKSYGCTGNPKDIQRECGLFPVDIDVEEWFKSKPQFVCFEREGKVIKVSVFIKRASYCLNYIKSTGCTDDNCKWFHLCKDMLCGHCAFDKKCWFSHDALDDRNRNVTRNLRLPNCTNEDIINILKVRLPRVCESWSEHGSCSDSTCTDLHVCPGFVNGKCKDDTCPKSHNLSSTHNEPIISAYGMTQWNEMFLKKSIYLQRKLQYDINVEEDDNGEIPNETERLGESAADFKSEQICERFLTKSCRKDNCKLIHNVNGLPYIWQAKLKDKWTNIPNCERFEAMFCNPKLDESNVIACNDFNEEKTTKLSVTFDPVLKGKVHESEIREAKTRRLSTLSYIHGKAKTDSFKTQWRWFWKDDVGRYILFEPETLQYTIEAKFLGRQKSYLYVQDNNQYRIDFEEMIQRRLNQNRPASNDIKRRPLYVSSKDVEGKQFPPSLAVQTVNISRPTSWMPWDLFQPFELVELQNNESDFSSVAGNFYKTLDKEKQIICRIYRVQNRKLWSSFCNHEESMMMSQTDQSSTLDKRNLYHGTDSDNAIRGICTNNFDFRLSGKNATRHGDGAYFASDAKYSHLYTNPPTRYMFQALVLVGSYTQGKPEYRRPPPKPGREHELYDSCVDNMDNPRIFVAFEKTQYYPEFLIEYCDKGDYPSTTTASSASPENDDPTTCCLQ